MPTPADYGWGNPRNLTSKDMVRADIGTGVPVTVRNQDCVTVFRELVRRLQAAGWKPNPNQPPDDWGYAKRLMRWAEDAGQRPATAPMTSWSSHAWGTAIDLDAVNNPMRSTRPLVWTRYTSFPAVTRDIAAPLGIAWGGSWDSPFDPMHFEIIVPPHELAGIASGTREDNDDVSYLKWPLEDRAKLVEDICNFYVGMKSGVDGDDGKETNIASQLLHAAMQADRAAKWADDIRAELVLLRELLQK